MQFSHRLFCFFPAAVTNSVKGQGIGLSLTAGCLRNTLTDRCNKLRHFNIQHAAAFAADKVGMGMGTGIVALLPVHMGNAHNKPLLCQHRKISVYSAQT